MKIVDSFITKVGRQTVLTALAMRAGKLFEAEHAELMELMKVDYQLDRGILNAVSGQLYAPQHAHTKADLPFKELISKLRKIEETHFISSVYADLKRWADINDVIESEFAAGAITEGQAASLLYYFYVSYSRFTIYPTNPLTFQGEYPTIIQEVEQALLDSWRSLIDEPVGYDRENLPFDKAYRSLICNTPPSEYLQTVAGVFESESIKNLLNERGVDEEFLLNIHTDITNELSNYADDTGTLPYQLVMVSLFINQLRIELERRNSK